MSTIPRATLDDLYRVEGKAELIAGSIVPLMSTGRLPNRIAGVIYREIDDYAAAYNIGEAYTGTVCFIVPMLSSGRESFSPDASLFAGPFGHYPMRFIDGPPTFAVEVRDENDYGTTAELEIAAKRADYFEAGTLVVWDVDPIAKSISCYRSTRPTSADVWVCGDGAHPEPAMPGDAEPAMPGWVVDVEAIFYR